MMPHGPDVLFRAARRDDSEAIARLHAASWRAHYRGSLSDAYLAGPIEAERSAVWSARLSEPAPGQVIVVGESGGDLIGLACAFLGQDPVWGTLIDNLHVRQDLKRGGIGRRLMAALAGRLIEREPPAPPVHLFVLEANHAARAFYDRIGGEAVEHTHHALPDGGSPQAVIRYAWATATRLLTLTRSQES